MEPQTIKPNTQSSVASRDPDLVRLRLAEKLATIDEDMPIKTELTTEEIYAYAKMKAYIKRMYTPLYEDKPYMDFNEAQGRMDEIVSKLNDPELMKSQDRYNAYLAATKPIRDYYEFILDPLTEVTINDDGVKVYRKPMPPVVYEEFFKQLMVLNVSKERKGRLEILNVAIVERALNGMMKLMGIGSEDKQKGLIDKAFGR